MNLCNRFFLFFLFPSVLHVFYLLSPAAGIMIARAAAVCGFVLVAAAAAVVICLLRVTPLARRGAVLGLVGPFVNTFHMQSGVGTKSFAASVCVIYTLCINAYLVKFSFENSLKSNS